MEHASQQCASSRTLSEGTLFNPCSRLAADLPTDGYLVLGEHQSGVTSMVGAIRISRARDPNAWERHDHGDELLLLLSGACTMTLRDAEGRTSARPMSKGDVLLIPRGVAHHATLHTEELELFFVTPRTGSREWSESGFKTESEQ